MPEKRFFPSLSQKEYIILEMLASKEEMYGLEMVDASNGSLKRGTIYVTLGRMIEKGYLQSREGGRSTGEAGIPLRKYKHSDLGEKLFKAQELAIKYLKMNLGWNS